MNRSAKMSEVTICAADSTSAPYSNRLDRHYLPITRSPDIFEMARMMIDAETIQSSDVSSSGKYFFFIAKSFDTFFHFFFRFLFILDDPFYDSDATYWSENELDAEGDAEEQPMDEDQDGQIWQIDDIDIAPNQEQEAARDNQL